MSGGWENLPKDAPKDNAPIAQRARKREAAAVAGANVAVSETDAIEDGEWISRIEYYFPHIWLGMLSILCALGIYSGVGKLPNPPW